MINLTSFVAYHAKVDPDRPAVLFEGHSVSYGELLDRAERVAAGLLSHGVEPGEVVAVLMRNSAAFLDLALAASHVGAVFLPINFRLSADEVAYIVENSGAKLLFADDELESNAAGPARVLIVDRAARTDARRLFPGSPRIEGVRRAPGDLFRLMYTSGTTDRPKGVMHSYENFYWKSSDHILALGLGRETRLLVVGPLYHVGAFDLPGIAVLWVGGLLSIQRDFAPDEVLAAIAADRLTGAWLAPVMMSAVLACPGRANYDVSSLEWVIGGGERTPESRIRSFSACFANARYIDAYGLTETCGGDTFMEPGREIEKIGSTGRALAHVEIEIHDNEGNRLGPDQTGEICVRGPKVTRGYWRDPEKTAACRFGDWFRTGDVGHLDADGFLFLTDRKKDIIISGGENIASSEVERVIYELPAVREVAVIGVPDEKWGERPVAVVTLEEGAELDLRTLVAHCRARLAAFKVPKDLVLRDELPRNPSGKVLKRVLRDELLS
ncbi:AMP-binding protein [Xanthobacter dioxanivorans]|uniref:3-methylmercaptopropionyl-CoA ligase n=1 Tax=Xanthobacter dioxanivorans TaxID=2528964 RepID=A0A974PTQ6_9HYPH|nr:AMP-binding protein [Xanthobacter dioxanivorans]QRG09306.1 AMP-binding protein [Xanthobacter dioxanivorans]